MIMLAIRQCAEWASTLITQNLTFLKEETSGNKGNLRTRYIYLLCLLPPIVCYICDALLICVVFALVWTANVAFYRMRATCVQAKCLLIVSCITTCTQSVETGGGGLEFKLKPTRIISENVLDRTLDARRSQSKCQIKARNTLTLPPRILSYVHSKILKRGDKPVTIHTCRTCFFVLCWWRWNGGVPAFYSVPWQLFLLFFVALFVCTKKSNQTIYTAKSEHCPPGPCAQRAKSRNQIIINQVRLSGKRFFRREWKNNVVWNTLSWPTTTKKTAKIGKLT